MAASSLFFLSSERMTSHVTVSVILLTLAVDSRC
jgi:hypothetical protein